MNIYRIMNIITLVHISILRYMVGLQLRRTARERSQACKVKAQLELELTKLSSSSSSTRLERELENTYLVSSAVCSPIWYMAALDVGLLPD